MTTLSTPRSAPSDDSTVAATVPSSSEVRLSYPSIRRVPSSPDGGGGGGGGCGLVLEGVRRGHGEVLVVLADGIRIRLIRKLANDLHRRVRVLKHVRGHGDEAVTGDPRAVRVGVQVVVPNVVGGGVPPGVLDAPELLRGRTHGVLAVPGEHHRVIPGGSKLGNGDAAVPGPLREVHAVESGVPLGVDGHGAHGAQHLADHGGVGGVDVDLPVPGVARVQDLVVVSGRAGRLLGLVGLSARHRGRRPRAEVLRGVPEALVREAVLEAQPGGAGPLDRELDVAARALPAILPVVDAALDLLGGEAALVAGHLVAAHLTVHGAGGGEGVARPAVALVADLRAALRHVVLEAPGVVLLGVRGVLADLRLVAGGIGVGLGAAVASVEAAVGVVAHAVALAVAEPGRLALDGARSPEALGGGLLRGAEFAVAAVAAPLAAELTIVTVGGALALARVVAPGDGGGVRVGEAGGALQVPRSVREAGGGLPVVLDHGVNAVHACEGGACPGTDAVLKRDAGDVGGVRGTAKRIVGLVVRLQHETGAGGLLDHPVPCVHLRRVDVNRGASDRAADIVRLAVLKSILRDVHAIIRPPVLDVLLGKGECILRDAREGARALDRHLAAVLSLSPRKEAQGQEEP
mmetsp:Transcript_29678/g.95365  ORF Transcript_29678/g.95365 Transcript_29678/m.95365 type:complete len:632 (-) Transcript_29678:88-1983(-)